MLSLLSDTLKSAGDLALSAGKFTGLVIELPNQVNRPLPSGQPRYVELETQPFTPPSAAGISTLEELRATRQGLQKKVEALDSDDKADQIDDKVRLASVAIKHANHPYYRRDVPAIMGGITGTATQTADVEKAQILARSISTAFQPHNSDVEALLHYINGKGIPLYTPQDGAEAVARFEKILGNLKNARAFNQIVEAMYQQSDKTLSQQDFKTKVSELIALSIILENVSPNIESIGRSDLAILKNGADNFPGFRVMGSQNTVDLPARCCSPTDSDKIEDLPATNLISAISGIPVELVLSLQDAALRTQLLKSKSE